eukprot:7466306-Heterocapsa_arctica.AAC.1
MSSTYTNFFTATVAKKLEAFFFLMMIVLASSLDNLTAPSLLNIILCVGLVARKHAMCSIFASVLACLQN